MAASCNSFFRSAISLGPHGGDIQEVSVWADIVRKLRRRRSSC